jgi:hypothetical protein
MGHVMKLVSYRRRLLGGAVLAAAALALAGCSFTATGGGQLPGADGGTATFGFSAVTKTVSTGSSTSTSGNTCSLNLGALTCTHVSGTYRDGPVSLRFTSGGNELPVGCNHLLFTYTSTNPAQPGSGSGSATVCDSGIGGSIKGDSFSITLYGLWSYTNSGTVTNGNITVKNS